MTERKTGILFIISIFTVSFCFCAAVFTGGYWWSERMFYDKMAAIAAAIPERQEMIMKVLKGTVPENLTAGKEILGRYGYYGKLPADMPGILFFVGSLMAAGICTAVIFFFIHREKIRLQKRTGKLTEYLREVEEGNYHISLDREQDLFSNLEDEIYKTVLALRESREAVVREKEALARNLADISHQFKTPLTALTVLGELLHRRISKAEDAEVVRKMERQTERLVSLSASLLTLSRADAGVLTFEMRKVPVSELIDCSLEAVLPLFEKKKQSIKIMGEKGALERASVFCDLGWMREAVGNLLKNASEHAPERTQVSVKVWDNPVFTGIAVEDGGAGFSEKELPHLFERFYRGKDAGGDSAGIGLSLAKALVEGQGGEIRAENRKEGGARFLIKFYKKA